MQGIKGSNAKGEEQQRCSVSLVPKTFFASLLLACFLPSFPSLSRFPSGFVLCASLCVCVCGRSIIDIMLKLGGWMGGWVGNKWNNNNNNNMLCYVMSCKLR